MNKKRKKQGSTVPQAESNEKLHIRLCHLCLHLNEATSDMSKCQKCGIPLTMETILKDLAANPTGDLAVDEDLMDEEEEALMGDAISMVTLQSMRKKFRRLNGLSVVW